MLQKVDPKSMDTVGICLVLSQSLELTHTIIHCGSTELLIPYLPTHTGYYGYNDTTEVVVELTDIFL